MMAPVDEAAVIVRRFRAAVESGRTDALRGLFSPRARLSGAVPGRVVASDGPDGIVAELAGWWSGTNRVDDWSTSRADGGIEMVVEWTDLSAPEHPVRQRHWLHLDGQGSISRHVVHSEQPRRRRSALGDPPRFLRGATYRTRLTTSGQSGAGLERATLADGRPVIVKYLSPSADWIMRATADTGREAELWLDGSRRDVVAGLENPIVAAERYDDGWAIAQHDVSAWLLPADRRIGGDESRRVIAAAHALHHQHRDRVPSSACTLAARAEMFSPRVAQAERWGADLVPKLVGRGWDLFPTAADGIVADDVVAALLTLVDDPAPLVAALERDGTTLIHGDLKHANLVLAPERVVAIDWGMACRAPAEVELAWYLECGAPWVAVEEDDLVASWRELRDPGVDPWRWHLALLFEIVISGWSWALFSRESPYAGERARCTAALTAWLARAREALDVCSP